MSDAVSFTLQPEHGLVLLAATGLAFQGLVDGIFVSVVRTGTFAKAIKRAKEQGDKSPHKDLLAEHEKATGSLPGRGGYPDAGNGRLSAVMTHGEWLQFIQAQRAHYNLIENLPLMLMALLVAGLFSPFEAALLGFALHFGRIVYAFGYRTAPALRSPGFLIGQICTITLLVMAVRGALGLAKLEENEYYVPRVLALLDGLKAAVLDSDLVKAAL